MCASISAQRACFAWTAPARAKPEFGLRRESSGEFRFRRDLDSVAECGAIDDLRRRVPTLRSAPGFRRRRRQLEDRRASRVLRQRAFHADGAMPDRGEDAFDGGSSINDPNDRRRSRKARAASRGLRAGRRRPCSIWARICRRMSSSSFPPRRDPAPAGFLADPHARWPARTRETCRARSSSCAAGAIDGASSATPRRGLSQSRARHRRRPTPARSTNRAPANRSARGGRWVWWPGC